MNKEIERKYLVTESPKYLDLINEAVIEQLYVGITKDSEVRIRKITTLDMNPQYILTIKSDGDLIREENEYEITKNDYNKIMVSINLPPIIKNQKIFKLDDGHYLEYNHVESNVKGGWQYAEVEFKSIKDAEDFNITQYIPDAIEVTNNKLYKMKNYWLSTRLGGIIPNKIINFHDIPDLPKDARDITISMAPYINATIQFINDTDKFIYDTINNINDLK